MVNITDNLCTKKGNSSIKSAVYNQSTAGYNGACSVYVKWKLLNMGKMCISLKITLVTSQDFQLTFLTLKWL